MNFHKITEPGGLLEGTGKNMRHIKLKTVDDINEGLLMEWFSTVPKEQNTSWLTQNAGGHRPPADSNSFFHT